MRPAEQVDVVPRTRNYAKEHARPRTVPPVGVDGCKNVPFSGLNTQVKPQTAGYDQPDGAITNVLVPQNEAEGQKSTRPTLPAATRCSPKASR